MNVRTIAVEVLALQGVFENNTIKYRSLCWKYQRKIRKHYREWLKKIPSIEEYINYKENNIRLIQIQDECIIDEKPYRR